MKNRLFVLLIVLAAIFALLPFTAFAQGEGVIEGQLVNGTREGSSVAGQTVYLSWYQNDSEIKTEETVSDEQGMFTFDGLYTGQDYSYRAEVSFQSVDYYSNFTDFAGDNNTQSVEIKVYDSTGDASGISVITSHVIFRVEGELLLIDEYYLFGNDSDYSYIGQTGTGDESGREVLQFSLPAGTGDVQYSGWADDSLIPTADGFANTVAVTPGMHETTFSYAVDFSGGRYEYNRKLFYPTGDIDLMVRGENLDVSSDEMGAVEPFEVGDDYYQHFISGELTSGQVLSVSISGKTSSGSGTAIVWIIIPVLVVVGVAYAVYYRRNKKSPVEISNGDTDEIDRLLKRIAGLDDDFEDGIINEDEYHDLRNELKKRLTDLMNEAEKEYPPEQ